MLCVRAGDFLRGGLNIELVSETGGLGGVGPQKLFITITPKSYLTQVNTKKF